MKVFAFLALLIGASTAHAGFVSTNDTSPQQTVSVASNNDFGSTLGTLGISSYSLGTTLSVNTSGYVTYYFYGKEAGYNNVFSSGGLSYATGSTSSGFGSGVEIGTAAVNAGALQFDFCASSGGASLGCVGNQANDGIGLNAFQSIAMSITDDSAWLFWDDSGADGDDDYDDMIIRAVFHPITSVPEPNTLAMFGLGLLAVGLSVRKKVAPRA